MKKKEVHEMASFSPNYTIHDKTDPRDVMKMRFVPGPDDNGINSGAPKPFRDSKTVIQSFLTLFEPVVKRPRYVIGNNSGSAVYMTDAGFEAQITLNRKTDEEAAQMAKDEAEALEAEVLEGLSSFIGWEMILAFRVAYWNSGLSLAERGYNADNLLDRVARGAARWAAGDRENTDDYGLTLMMMRIVKAGPLATAIFCAANDAGSTVGDWLKIINQYRYQAALELEARYEQEQAALDELIEIGKKAFKQYDDKEDK